MKDLETKIRNLTFIVVFGFIITFMLIIGLYFTKSNATVENNATTNNNSNSNNNTTTDNYDVSKMKEVDVDGALALFKSKKTEVLYIGRSDCSACIATVPYLNQVQEELNYTTNYMDLNVLINKYSAKYDKSDADFGEKVWAGVQSEIKELMDLIKIDGSANGNTGAMGALFYEAGYTPLVVVIKDGYAVDGFFGAHSAEDIKTMMSKYF